MVGFQEKTHSYTFWGGSKQVVLISSVAYIARLFGTDLHHSTLNNVYVLASAFVDGNYIVPVKLEVKEFADKQNTLHVAIALESIRKDGIVKQEVAREGVARQVSPPSDISIAE